MGDWPRFGTVPKPAQLQLTWTLLVVVQVLASTCGGILKQLSSIFACTLVYLLVNLAHGRSFADSRVEQLVRLTVADGCWRNISYTEFNDRLWSSWSKISSWSKTSSWSCWPTSVGRALAIWHPSEVQPPYAGVFPSSALPFAHFHIYLFTSWACVRVSHLCVFEWVACTMKNFMTRASKWLLDPNGVETHWPDWWQVYAFSSSNEGQRLRALSETAILKYPSLTFTSTWQLLHYKAL